MPMSKDERQLALKIGKNIRDERRSAGWTQLELAAKVGLTANYIAHLERGSRGASLGTLCKLTRALSISIREVVS